MDDRAIVELFLHRDEAAIPRTAEKYGRRLRGLAQHILEDLQAAEECENDTYLEAWNTIPPKEPRDYLYAYLACIARHLALDLCRRRGRRKRSAFLCTLSTELEQCLPAADDCACRVEQLVLREAINGFLGALSEEKRNVFLRRYWYLDSISDIARRYAMSQSKVKMMLLRSREQFRCYLEQEGYKL